MGKPSAMHATALPPSNLTPSNRPAGVVHVARIPFAAIALPDGDVLVRADEPPRRVRTGMQRKASRAR